MIKFLRRKRKEEYEQEDKKKKKNCGFRSLTFYLQKDIHMEGGI